jgi:hypothetical protein
MPKTKISEFSSTPANNTDIDSINIAEGCAPSGINDAIRELMAQLKDFQTGSAGDPFNGATAGAHNGTVGATTPAAGTFTTLASTGNTTLGDAAADTVTVNGTANFVAAPTIGGVGLGMGFKNRIINGDMRISQRNATASVSISGVVNTYTLDRWVIRNDAEGIVSVEQSSTAPTGFNNSLLYTVTTADASLGASQNYSVQQRIEGFNMADFGWGTASAQTVTLSFWVRSSLTGTFGGAISNSAANRSYPFTYTISVANTWEQKTVTIAGDTTGTWLTTNGIGAYLYFATGAGSTVSGTAGAWGGADYRSATGAVNLISTAGATFYITGVQLEKGSTATSFDYRPYGTELALCQRYLPCFNTTGTAGFEIGAGFYATTTIARITVAFPVETRVSPTGVTAVNPANFTANGNANSIASAIAFGGCGTKAGCLDVTIPATSIVAGYGVHLIGNSSGTGQIQFTGCEL